ncbi:MAG: hypothetical protein LBI29_03055 [Rickettsiales bacterium]|jgi:type IV secretion system protein VirB4|nr:hypothetical protein [Rickettsiales bacterium]
MEKLENSIFDDLNTGLYAADGQQNSVNPDLIPYTCYYNDHTLVTQNGDMLQIIKIPSFVSNTGKSNFYLLREELNKSFVKNANNHNLSFWFQTIRKSVDLIPRNQNYESYVPKLVMGRWNRHYNWNNQFANEIYIAIVFSLESGAVSKVIEFIEAINLSMLQKSRDKGFEKSLSVLSGVSKGMLKDLEPYGARLLKIVKKDDTYYSEHLKLFSLLVNGVYKNVKLPVNELSHSFLSKKIAYGKNLIQIYDKGSSLYSAMVSLKYCNLLMPSQLDKIIQLDQEMVITQSVSFINSKPINDEMLKYFETLSLNEDPIILNISDIGAMLPDKNQEKNRVCISQVIISIKAKSKEELNKNLERLFEATGKLGLVAVREEMFMPTLFWSQLPGNFNFVRRLHSIPLDNVCAFASLFSFPTGKLTGNIWGDSMIVLKSALGTPYFFSFDTKKNPNTLIIGPKSAKKTRYMNFMLIAATKQVGRIVYIDNTNRSRLFINSLSGKYYSISRKESDEKLYLNPFAMEKNDKNLEFILEWLSFIIEKSDDGMVKLGEETTKLNQEWGKLKEIIKNDIDKIKKIGDVFDIAKQEKFSKICKSLNRWVDPTRYGFIFNTEHSTDIFASNITGLNFNTIVNNEEIRIAIFTHLVHSLATKSGNEPTILAIDEGWLQLDNSYIAPKISKLLKALYDKNVAVIMTTSGADSYETSSIQLSVRNVFPTQLLLPNVKASIYQRKVFDITEEESRIISVMREDNGTMLIRHNGNIVISSIDFDFLTKDELYIFSSGTLHSKIMAKAKELVKSDKPEDWLPVMLKLMQEYNKVKLEEKLKEREKRQIQWEEAKQKKDMQS